MKKIILLFLLLLIVGEISAVTQLSEANSQSNVTTAKVAKITVFEIINTPAVQGTNQVIHATIKNVGNDILNFNATVISPDSSEILNLSTNTKLLPLESADLYKVYSTTPLSVGVHPFTLNITSNETINFVPINNSYSTINFTIQSSSGSGGGNNNNNGAGGGGAGTTGGESTSLPENGNQQLNNLINNLPVIVPSAQQLNSISTNQFENVQYTEGTPDTGFELNYNANKDFNENQISLTGLPQGWNYQITKTGSTTFKLNLQAGGSKYNYGINKIQLTLAGDPYFAVIAVNLVTPRNFAVLRTVEVPRDNINTPNVKLDVLTNYSKPSVIGVDEHIPESFASNTDQLNFSIQPTILQKDPEVKWEVYFQKEGNQTIRYNRLTPTNTTILSFTELLKGFTSDVQIIPMASEEPVTFQLYSPDTMQPGETKNLTLQVMNGLLNEINATVEVQVIPPCYSPISPANITLEPRSKETYEIPLICPLNTQEGQYSGTILITGQEINTIKTFNFIVTKAQGMINLEPYIIIIIIIIISIIFAINVYLIYRKKKKNRL
ncbi:Uncharacterised protein [uncultured archaeon]|nr:Uncharacterised protein [uncultured archaeon]